MKLCIASNNTHKIGEFKKLIGSTFEVLSLKEIGCDEEIPEEQPTIEGNSLQKAQYIWDNYKVNCFSDDTGLEVGSLNNEPGVYSAMYAGPQRNSMANSELVLQKLLNFENRNAKFRTVVTLILGGEVHQFEGIVEGNIVSVPRGSNGFGYDSIFEPEGYLKTFAEMTMEEKNAISHRARALEKLVLFLKNI